MAIFDIFRRNKVKRDVQVFENQPQKQSHSYSPAGLTFSLLRHIDDPENLSTFFGGVELISNSIAEVPILVKEVETNDEYKKHPLYNALKYGKMTKFNLIKQLIHDIYVAGNGLVYIERDNNGDVKKLHYCAPGTYSIFVDEITKTVYYQINFIKEGKILDASNVIHVFKNTKNGLSGVGIANYANIVFPLASAADKSAIEFYDSGGNISGILQSRRDLDTEQKMDAYNEWTNAFRGGNKNGNIAVLGNDFEYKQVGISQKDAQQLETREFNVLEICRYLNINPILLGVKTGSTYNNIEQAQLDLVIHTLLPLINLIEEEFNRKLIRPSQRDKYYIDFDEDKIMFSDRASISNYYINLTKNGIISINEARNALGYKERSQSECDALFVPFTNIEQNTISKDKDPKPDKEDNKEDNQDE